MTLREIALRVMATVMLIANRFSRGRGCRLEESVAPADRESSGCLVIRVFICA
jgi:hypothetical protein